MRTNFKLRRLPRAASLLRTVALAAVLLTAATSLGQSININGGNVTANGGTKDTQRGDAMGAGVTTNAITVTAANYMVVKAGNDSSSATDIGIGDITNALKGRAYANAVLKTYTVTASANDANFGTVDGGGNLEHFTNATLTATPKTGYHFVNWTEDSEEVTTENPYTFEVTGARTLVANFAINTYEIAVSATPSESGNVSLLYAETGEPVEGLTQVVHGTRLLIRAETIGDNAFKGWYDKSTGNMFSGKFEYTFNATQNLELEARFTDAVIWVRVKK